MTRALERGALPAETPAPRLVHSRAALAERRGGTTRRALPSFLAGTIVVVVASSSFVAGALDVRIPLAFAGPAPGFAVQQTVAATEAPSSGGSEVLVTSNLRARDDRESPVLAVVPEGRAVDVLARDASGGWVLARYPARGAASGAALDDAAGAVRGWLPVDRLAADREAARALVADLEVTPGDVLVREAGSAAAEATSARPDLAFGTVFLQRDGRLSVELRNGGDAPLEGALVPLHVSRLSGETVGVLEVGPIDLAAGALASVVTPVVVPSTGTYILTLDRAGDLAESDESNNTITRLLVTGGG